MEAGGLMNAAHKSYFSGRSLPEALRSELVHFKRPDVVELLLSYGALGDDAEALDRVGFWEFAVITSASSAGVLVRPKYPERVLRYGIIPIR